MGTVSRLVTRHIQRPSGGGGDKAYLRLDLNRFLASFLLSSFLLLLQYPPFYTLPVAKYGYRSKKTYA